MPTGNDRKKGENSKSSTIEPPTRNRIRSSYRAFGKRSATSAEPFAVFALSDVVADD